MARNGMLRVSQLLSGGYLVLALLLIGVTLFVGPVGWAPLQLPLLGPAGEPVTLTVAYGTEKKVWLEEAARQFAATNPRVNGRPIQVKLEGIGSREIVTRITQEDYQPTVFNPASSIQIELLRQEWRTRRGGEIFLDGVDEPQPLVLTPLVLVAWEERAQALWPNGPQTIWRDVQKALVNDQGWKGIPNGKEEWGFVKFGHTSPETSNSGTQTLVLLAYAYHNKTNGLTAGDMTDPQFQEWLDGIERSVLEFGDSTGTFMTDMVNFGPGKYDFVAVYENLALENIENAKGKWGPIRIYYPPANIFSDHPYATLNAPWVTPEQRSAAAQFRSFLLGREMQELARQYGFRPANPSVPVITNDPNNPFNRYKDYGVAIDIPQVVATPSADVLNELITLWRRKNYDR
jgi:ABC-type molybdate transport system substrate-binding protein